MRRQIKAAGAYTAQKTRDAAWQGYRLVVELLVLILAGGLLFWSGIPWTNAQMVLFKLVQFAIIVMYIHIGRQFLFDYIGLKGAIYGTGGWCDIPPVVRAAAVLGIFIFYAAGIVGFMTGL